MHKGLIISAVITLCIFLLTGCADTQVSSNPAYKLSFSRDTITFDTVFTTIGSASGSFLIYNHNSKPLSIGSVSLSNGASSGFRINVDGTIPSGNTISDIEIRAHDSLFVFVSVTVNPTNKNNPVLIRDSIVCLTNGNRQTVQLTAYGQDVSIFRSKTLRNDTVLSAEKPFLIYNYLAIDNGKTLTIKPGTTLYFHKGATIKAAGNIKAEGTRAQRITFRSDRLDKLFDGVPYSYLSGQWDGIQLTTPQASATFNYADITGAHTALLATEGSVSQSPAININNSRIQNCDSSGIITHNANLKIYNSEITNCQSSCLDITGGTHTLIHTTIANYYNDYYGGKYRDGSPAVSLSNIENSNSQSKTIPLKVQFINCAIAGSMNKELSMSDTTRSTTLSYLFDHCYLRSTAIKSTSFNNIVWGTNKDQLFARTSISSNKYFDFRPTEQSLLRRQSNIEYSQQATFAVDMNGIWRLWEKAPDIGAYQWNEP